jgi:rhodanese-related sulfurtransferase
LASADKENIAMHKKLSGRTVLLIIVLVGLVLPSCRAQQDQDITAVSPSEATALIEKHQGDASFVILDIRTPGEYHSGHLKGAIMIDYYSKSFAEDIGRLDTEKSYLVYCRSGNRSARSMDLFRKLQFQKVYHLASGINSWISAGLPLER